MIDIISHNKGVEKMIMKFDEWMMNVPEGYMIVLDDNYERLLLALYDFAIAYFNVYTKQWEKFPKCWMMKIGYANPVSIEEIESITGGIYPTSDVIYGYGKCWESGIKNESVD